MKKILLIATGGTIASRRTNSGLKPSMTPEELLNSLSVMPPCELDTKELFSIDSTDFTPDHWLLIAKEIKENYEAYDGFVITHGTDTMAYTAAALSYLIRDPGKPIVLTGSQRTLADDFSDVKHNLGDALFFACEDDIAGVFIVFCGRAILGTRACKTRTKSVEAFESINYPCVAMIDNGRIIKYTGLGKTGRAVHFYDKLDRSVFLLKLIPGMSSDILDFLKGRYRAVVIESFGSGGIPSGSNREFYEKLGELVKGGCIVVLTTQVMNEGSNAMLYEVGANAMKEYNLLQGFDMTTEAVVAKLMWLMSLTDDNEKVSEEFYKPIGFDILSV